MRDNYNELSGCNTDKNNLEKDRVDYDSHLNSLVQKVSNTILYSPLTKNLYSSLYNVVAPPILQPIGNAIRALNIVLGCDDSVNINNIEQWEESHDNDNKELRNTLDVMKSNRLTTPFAVAYENLMDKKELRGAAFPFKSLKHTIAATDIFPGIKYKNYKISYENISTQAQMFADEYHRLYNENISKKKLPENVYYLLYKRFLQLNENSK